MLFLTEMSEYLSVPRSPFGFRNICFPINCRDFHYFIKIMMMGNTASYVFSLITPPAQKVNKKFQPRLLIRLIPVQLFRDSLVLSGVSFVVAIALRYLASAPATSPRWVSGIIRWILSYRPGQLFLLTKMSPAVNI
jgi:hypothetical protein